MSAICGFVGPVRYKIRDSGQDGFGLVGEEYAHARVGERVSLKFECSNDLPIVRYDGRGAAPFARFH